MQVEQVKAKIQAIIDDFKANKEKYERGSEADVETKLIEPLFEALGWATKDFDKRPQARREGKRGIADYAFKIGDKIVFYLEAKKVGVFLERKADKQVISYALSKRIPFAVSTNFEELKIFCVEQADAITQTFRVFQKPDNYLTNIQDLLLLSKESFEQNLTLQKAESEGRLKKRMSIDKALLNDLIYMRKLMVEDIEKSYPEKYDLNEKEEIVQRIIDRLIFIRRSEDVGINPDNFSLKEITKLPHDDAPPKLKHFFKKYNEVYNSGLFAVGVDNDCDKITIRGSIIKDLIECLYESKDKQYVYNFDWIDADVLGQIYEQYLGIILRQTKSGKAKLKNGQLHRKESGIYYTPTDIVDFIVKNTLGGLLKDKKLKPKELKILDSACGSGSFLIKAFDYLYGDLENKEESKQHKLDGQGSYSIKTEILKKNLYGVDLDNKAVEITKLNLLLKAAEKNRKLPEELDAHIKHGNSLVDNEKAIDTFPFKWEEDFKEGSFDVIIGNPPYVSFGIGRTGKLNKEYQNYFYSKFSNSAEYKISTYALFIELAIRLSKQNGNIGLIIPDSFLVGRYFSKIRKYILDSCLIKKLVLFEKDFWESGAVGFPVIIILTKNDNTNSRRKNNIEIISCSAPENLTKEKYVSMLCKQIVFERSFRNRFRLIFNKEKNKILEKIDNGANPLEQYIAFHHGIRSKVGRDKIISKRNEGKNWVKGLIHSNEINCYSLTYEGNFILINPGYLFSGGWNKKLIEQDKILIRRTGDRLIATIDVSGLYHTNAIIYGIRKGNLQLKTILALLNSKLMNFYYQQTTMKTGRLFPQVEIDTINQLPIKSSEQFQKSIESFVDKMLSLNKRLSEIGEKNTAKTKDLKDKIEQLDKDINKEVYALYGLTDKEISIIENS